MKLAWKIIAGAAALAVLGAVLWLRPDHRERDAAEATRLELRKQGVKTDLADFSFSATPEERARAAALTNANPERPRASGPNYPARLSLLQGGPDLFQVVNSNTVLVVWREKVLPNFSLAQWLTTQDAEQTRDLWPPLADLLAEEKPVLDDACQAALSGPIRFELDASQGRGMVMRHVPGLRYLGQTLGTRAVFELWRTNAGAAFTNLLAATRLVTAWEPEPCEISHLVRFGCAGAVFEATWQALQFDGWADEQLAQLQYEWSAADFRRGLPLTEEFALASDRDLLEKDRRSRLDLGMPVAYMIRYPRNALGSLKGYWRRALYRHHGSYEDEKGLMLYHRARESEWEKAVEAPSWAEMRDLPGVTNVIPYRSRYAGIVVTPVTASQVVARFQGPGEGLPARLAVTEARRRVILTALALERFHLAHHRYPQALSELSPAYLPVVPMDFMDGKPLRYRLGADGHFVLYSVGLDCVDDGGAMAPDQNFGANPYRALRRLGLRQTGDIVWPRPASAAEVRAYFAEQKKQQETLIARARVASEEQERLAEEARVLAVNNLLSQRSLSRADEPEFRGKPLYKVLRDPKIASGRNLTLDDLLTVRQVITGQEPDIATFEVQASYDAVTNVGTLELLVDEDNADLSQSDGSEMAPVRRSTNGTCLLVWNTGTDAPGLHAVQAQLSYEDGPRRNRRSLEIKGPAAPYYSSNLCQFVVEQCSLNTTGAVLYAKLPESNGIFKVELKTMKGAHLKTIEGRTTNGVIEVKWNLIDDAGHRYVDQALDSVFHVTLPGSGRSMTQRGP